MTTTFTAEQLATMTPVEVDTLLAPIWERENEILFSSIRTRRVITKLEERVDKVLLGLKVTDVRTPADGVRLAQTLHAEQRALASLDEQMQAVRAEAAPYEAEYLRRGGWNRVYLAKSAGGHAHNGTECSTCHHGEYRTEFAWLIQYSGKTEAEIVADAGERACTTCYPTAPASDLKRKTKMFTPDEIEAQKAREERQQAQAQRAADKNAKGITAPDGSPLRDAHGSKIATERTAVIEATDALSDRYKNLRIEQILKADSDLEPFFLDRERRERNEAKERAYALRLIEAIAHKRGVSAEEVLAELGPKALAKAKRDMGSKDWAQNFRYNAAIQREEFEAYKAKCEAEGRTPFEALSSRWAKF
jgi:hypothetical protein